MEIYNVKDRLDLLEESINYIHSKWGSSENYLFYKDAILNSHIDRLPCFYIALIDQKIVACYALITNDFVSRQDLFPYFACLYVEEAHRGKRIGEKLFQHAKKEVKALGYRTMYLVTDLENYYEKFEWKFLCHAYLVFGDHIKIYYQDIEK